MERKKKVIDISTRERKKEVFEKFDSFSSKNQAHKYFGISDNTQGANYLKEIAESVGFNMSVYKDRHNTPKKYCKECGKEISNKWAKSFCSSSCSAKYNNKHRDKAIYKKIGDKLRKKGHKQDKDVEKFCAICGKKLEGHQRKYCSKSCRNRNKYISNGKEYTCQECGKIIKSRHSNRKFCSNKCCSIHRSKEYIEKWENEELTLDPNLKLPKTIRKFLFEKAHYKCEECGFEGYNRATKNTILQIHHIDGNSGNNTTKNLKVLCPNCHAMTENYMALNKGKSARDKRYNRRGQLAGSKV